MISLVLLFKHNSFKNAPTILELFFIYSSENINLLSDIILVFNSFALSFQITPTTAYKWCWYMFNNKIKVKRDEKVIFVNGNCFCCHGC